MATTDIEKLVVQLSADVRGYQKSLDKARAATNRTAGDIEKRFGRMNKSISTIGAGLKSAFAGFGAGLASSLTVSAIGNMIKSVADLKDQAERAGTSAESLQALGFAARQSGAEVSDVVQALGILNKKVAEARQKQKGPLFELFAANNKKFSDDAVENLKTIAELFRNAKTEQDKFLIGQTGLGKGFQVLVPLLNEGANGIERMMGVARESGAVIEERLVRKAAEFDDAWTKAFDIFSTTGKAAVISIAEEIEKIIKAGGEFGELLERLIKLLPQVKIGEPLTIKSTGGGLLGLLGVGENTVFGGTPLDRAKEKFKDLQTQMDKLVLSNAPQEAIEALQAEIRRTREEVERLQAALTGLGKPGNIQFGGPTTGPASSNFGGGVPTIIPPGAGSEGDESADKFDSAVDKFVQTVIDFENAGGKAVGKNPFSSAEGIGQFINSTFIEQFKKAFPGLATLSDPEILAKRNDPRIAVQLIKQYARENAEFLAEKLKVPIESITNAELQLAHFLGPGGAAKVLQAPAGTPIENVLSQKAIADNRGVLAGKTTDEVIAEANARAGLSGAIRDNRTALQEFQQSAQIDIDEMRVRAAELGAVTEAQKVAAREQELLNQAQQKGLTITPELKAQIHDLAVQWGEQAQSLENVKAAQDAAAESAKALKEAQEQAAQTAQEVANAFGSAFQGFISDLAHGKKLTDALRDALLKLGESLLNIALDNLLGGIGGGAAGGAGGGGILGSLFGGLFHQGGVAGRGGHGRRVPALAFAGAPRYHGGGFAGLQQGEIPAILKRGEIVFPNMDAVRNAVSRQGNGAGGGIVQNNTFVSPSWKAAERSQNQIARTAGASLDRVRRTL